MKAMFGILTLLVTAVVAMAAWRGGASLVAEGFKRGGKETLTLLPLLAAVFILTGFVQVLLPPELVTRWLSAEAGWRGIGIAWFAGALTPGGGPLGLPIAATLLRSGASVGIVVTYLTSLSLLSLVRIPMELGIYGGRMTALRWCASCALPPVIGTVAQVVGRLSAR